MLNIEDRILIEKIEQKDDYISLLSKIKFIIRDSKHVMCEMGKPIAAHVYLDNYLFEEKKSE